MEVKERIRDYNKVIANNKHLINIYNELIRLEREGLEDSQSYLVCVDLLKRLKRENKKLLKKYPLMDAGTDYYMSLLIVEPCIEYGEDDGNYKDDDEENEAIRNMEPFSEEDFYGDEYGGIATLQKDNKEKEEVIYDMDKDGDFNLDNYTEEDKNDSYEDNEKFPKFDIEYKLDSEAESKIRFRNDIFWYGLVSKEYNKNQFYGDKRTYVLGSYLTRHYAIARLHQSNPSMSIEEAEAEIDEKLAKEFGDSYFIEKKYELSMKKLVDYYENGFFHNSTMLYLLDSIARTEDTSLRDILIARKYRLIAESRCLEDEFLINPKNFVNIAAFKKPLQSLYSSESTRELCFKNWEEYYLDRIHALEQCFFCYENCIDDIECLAHNINTKAILQAYTSMLFDKTDLEKVYNKRNTIINDVQEECVRKIIIDSKALKRTNTLSEK